MLRRCVGTPCLLLVLFAIDGKSFAGGFDRFEQGIDLLFDPGRVTFDASIAYSMPTRHYNTVNSAPESVEFGKSKLRRSLNLKFDVIDNAACLASYREPFGVDSDFGSTWSEADEVVSRMLNVEEFALTCSYRVEAGLGYVRFIGGVTRDHGTYEEDALIGALRPKVELEGWTTGWRAGFAYEIPAKAIRASLVYNSDLDFLATGTFRDVPNLPAEVPVHASASIPQTVEATVQFPLSKTWINSISVKWADWSIWTLVPVALSEDAGGLSAGDALSTIEAFYRDGWTIEETLAHVWSNELTLLFRVSWDRGVTTGWSEYTDTWSASVGAIYKIYPTLELYGGAGFAVLTPGEIDKVDDGGDYDATLPIDYAFGLRTGVRRRF
jgi:long-chain fatty acid transport protein